MLKQHTPDIVFTGRWHVVSYYIDNIYVDNAQYQTMVIDCCRTTVPRFWPGREVRERCHLLFEQSGGEAVWSAYASRFNKWEKQALLHPSLQQQLNSRAIAECLRSISDLRRQIQSLTSTPE